LITESQIKAALRAAPTCGKKSIELKDGGSRGDGRLALIVRPLASQIASEWYAVYYRGGKRTMTKIGAYPTLGLAEARKMFRESYAPVISAGQTPTGARARRSRRGVTVRDLFEAYLEHLEKTAGPRSVNGARYILFGAKDGRGGAAKALGETMRAADVTPKDIAAHLSEIHKRGSVVQAANVRSYLSAAYNFAIKSSNSYTQTSGLVEWGLTSNPVSAIPADPAAFRAGQRHLSPSELRAFWMWLDKLKWSAIGPVLQLMICTGQRTTEILGLTTGHFDRNENMLDWSKTKNQKPHAIPLPPRAVMILSDLVPNKQGLLFPGRIDPGEPAQFATVNKLVRRYVEDAGATSFTPRDLRRTWKTLAGAAGLSKDIRDRLQNHTHGDVSSRHYDRYEYLPEKRAAMAMWSAYLDRILAGEFDKDAMKAAA
jgi:integrase